MRPRLRLHDPGQRVPDAPARNQVEGRQPQPDSEEQGVRAEHPHREDHHAGLVALFCRFLNLLDCLQSKMLDRMVPYNLVNLT